MKRVIGLMGNSGSGKSTVAQYLEKKGAYIIDADEISHSVCEQGQPGLEAVKACFDPYFFNEDGTLNRRRMGRHVFADKQELRKLEAALHPIIVAQVREEVEKRQAGVVAIDCALLISTGLKQLTDEVWLIKADINTKINRICARDALPYEQAINRLRNQRNDDELVKYADKVILNDGTEEMLIAQVEEYLNERKKEDR